jgi:hypothetical protein
MPAKPKMDAPQDIASLLRGDPQGFDVGTYFTRFAASQYAYLEGFNEFCRACVLEGGFKSFKLGIAAIQQAMAEAVTAAPSSWKDQFTGGQWDVCHVEQVTSARDYSPMCLEKALLVVLATAIACKRPAFVVLNRLNPFDFITIHPAIYRLTGEETWAVLLNKLSRRMTRSEHGLISQIKEKLQSAAPRDKVHATPARAGALITQAFAGRGMTWKNADLLCRAFNEPVFGKTRLANDVPGEDCLRIPMGVRVLKGRNDGGKFTKSKRCNDDEGPFVTLAKEEFAMLREAVDANTATMRVRK